MREFGPRERAVHNCIKEGDGVCKCVSLFDLLLSGQIFLPSFPRSTRGLLAERHRHNDDGDGH